MYTNYCLSGDITRERTSKQNLIKDGLTSITGLAFHSQGKTTYLYVATVSSIEMYEIPYKDKDNRVGLNGFIIYYLNIIYVISL